jgi:hypothetical protein
MASFLHVRLVVVLSVQVFSEMAAVIPRLVLSLLNQ